MRQAPRTTIDSIINEMSPANYSITFLENSENEYIYPGQNVIDDLAYKFGFRQFYINPNVNKELQFRSLFRLFADKWGKNYDRIYESLLAEYNPISNYDRTETKNTKLTGGHQTTDTTSVETTTENEQTMTGGHSNVQNRDLETTRESTDKKTGGHIEVEEYPQNAQRTTTTTKSGSHTESEILSGGHTNIESKSGSHVETEVLTGGHSQIDTKSGGHTDTLTKTGGHTETEHKTGGHTATENYYNYNETKQTTGGYTDTKTNGLVTTSQVAPEDAENFYNTTKTTNSGNDSTSRTYASGTGLSESLTKSGEKRESFNYSNPDGENTLNDFSYKQNGEIEQHVIAFDPQTGEQLEQSFHYDTIGGERKETTFEYDPQSGEQVEQSFRYDAVSGERKETTFEYDPNDGESETVTESGQKKTTFTYQDNEGEESDYNESSTDTGSVTDTFSYSNEKQTTESTVTSEHSGGVKTEYLPGGENESTTIRAYGNIGVTTNQQMIKSEIELRVYNIVNEYIEAFIKEYTFLY